MSEPVLTAQLTGELYLWRRVPTPGPVRRAVLRAEDVEADDQVTAAVALLG